jgi:hypothetical protein
MRQRQPMANETRNVKFGTKTDNKHITYEYYIITPKKVTNVTTENFDTMSENYCAVGN